MPSQEQPMRISIVKWAIAVTPVALIVLTPTEGLGDVIHVDADATEVMHDGSTWCSAFLTLQEGLDTAAAGDTILVANGTYKPDRGTGNRAATFQLISGVAIEGGYAGCGAIDPDQRNIAAFETVLTGDLDNDDGPGFTNNGENSRTVVTGNSTASTAVLDGVTITAGNSDNPTNTPEGNGGGMYTRGGSPTLRQCTFRGNSAWANGGGMYNIGASSPTLIDCTFSRNRSVAGGGGGMGNQQSSPTLAACRFLGNVATGSGGGGGMKNNNNSSPSLINCVFTGNSSFRTAPTGGVRSGGGMRNDIESNPTVVNCTFSGNSAEAGGGMNNVADSIPTLTNCVLWNNVPDEIVGSAAVTYSNIQGSWAGDGNIDDNPQFVDPDGHDDIVGTEDDNLRLSPSSPCIDAGNNTTVPPGVTTDLDGNPRFIDDPSTEDCPQPGADCGEPPIVDMGAYEFDPIRCGNGVIEGPEDCEPPGSDCCDAACHVEPVDALCGDSSDTDCDNPDTCDDSGNCLSNHEPPTTVCRLATGECDIPEFCGTTATISPDADTYITNHRRLGGSNSNHGVDEDIWVIGAAPSFLTHGLLRFDLGPYAGRTVSGATATVELFLRTLHGCPVGFVCGDDPCPFNRQQTIGVHESLVDWAEGTVTYNSFGGDAGIQPDEVGPALSSVLVTRDDNLCGYVSWTIPADLVQQWIDDASNNRGLALISQTNQTVQDMVFETREGEFAPRLTFDIGSGECPPDDFVAAGTPCTDDGSVCTDDFCVAHECQHPPRIDCESPVVTCSAAAPSDDVDDEDDHDKRDDTLLIAFDASEGCGSVVVSAVIDIGCGQIPVDDGQIVELECGDDDCEVEDEDGILEIEAGTAVLIATADDECGGTSICELDLCSLLEDDDDDNDHQAEDHNEDDHDGDDHADDENDDDDDSDDDENGDEDEEQHHSAKESFDENALLDIGGTTCGAFSPAIILLMFVGMHLIRPRRA